MTTGEVVALVLVYELVTSPVRWLATRTYYALRRQRWPIPNRSMKWSVKP